MTGPEFACPVQGDHETDAEYWARVRAMGLPYLGEWGKTVPPGPITVTHEWSLRDPNSDLGPLLEGNFVASREDVGLMRDAHPEYILVRRTRWVAVSEWEDVP
jgi:hypothetical protein